MRKFWISWYQPTEDYRPLSDPPNVRVLGWWCTGYDAEDVPILCALVVGADEVQAKAAVLGDWPEARDWRFCDASDGKLGDRFPLKDWMRDRIKAEQKEEEG